MQNAKILQGGSETPATTLGEVLKFAASKPGASKQLNVAMHML